MSAVSAVDFRLDFDRRRRTGLDEAVFAEGKSTDQLSRILQAARTRGSALLLTRLSGEKYRALGEWWPQLDYCEISRTAFFDRATDSPRTPSVAIVSGGTSDISVAREAERTLLFSGIGTANFLDVGVAGLWRLTACLESISRYPVVIAVAGMDAALPTVLAGLVSSVIIAVPTSVGYGVAAGGETALRAVLASCAPGLVTVNIDNGYGAACAALRSLGNRVPSHLKVAEV